VDVEVDDEDDVEVSCFVQPHSVHSAATVSNWEHKGTYRISS
jgi:hypothetical protein